MKNLEKNIFEYLSAHLSPKRFEHSYYVSVFAVKLALKYDIDILKVQTAALLHDCAKWMKEEELVKFLKKEKKSIKYFKEISKYAPQLLHSFAGEKIIKEKFKIKDSEIISPVRYHTLARPGMSVFDKILFISDAVAEDRKYKGVKKIREKALNDLDEAFITVLANKIKYVINSGLWLCPASVEVWNYYAKKN